MTEMHHSTFRTDTGQTLTLITEHDGYVIPPTITTTAPGGDSKVYVYGGEVEDTLTADDVDIVHALPVGTVFLDVDLIAYQVETDTIGATRFYEAGVELPIQPETLRYPIRIIHQGTGEQA
jgi:hypothetical protein